MRVYLCHYYTGWSLREKMFDLVHHRWLLTDGIELVVWHGRDNPQFQRERRIYAPAGEKPGDIYVLADDDCLPVTPFFVAKGRKILEDHHDFAILSMHPHTIQQWNPPHYVTKVDDDVQEHVSVGGIRFCRAGCLSDWPPMVENEPGYDRIQCDALREAGWRVGYFNNLFMNHIGEGFSSIWPHQKPEFVSPGSPPVSPTEFGPLSNSSPG